MATADLDTTWRIWNKSAARNKQTLAKAKADQRRAEAAEAQLR